MPNFQNTEIYKIVNEEETFCYVGSTTDFRRRRYNHKRSCNNENDKRYNSNLYKTIRENGGWEKFKFESIENYPCNNHREQFLREQYWINELKPNVNNRNAYTDMKEYNKEYHVNHKEKNNAKDKEYYQNHKEERTEYYKEYREKNKEEISERNKKKFNCDCGSVVRTRDKLQHYKTKKHQAFINK